MTVFRSAIAVFVLAAVAVPLIAQTKSYSLEDQRRRHYSVAGAGESAMYRVTSILQSSELEERTVYLVEDSEDGARYIILSSINFFDGTNSHQIWDAKTKHSLSASIRMPFKAKTRTTVLEEFRAAGGPKTFAERDFAVLIEAGGLDLVAAESQWSQPDESRDLRTQLRQAASPALLEGLERMRAAHLFAADSQLHVVCGAVVSKILYGEQCEMTHRPAIVWEKGDCSFDSSFGFPCSNAQKRRVDKMHRDETTETYFY
jgi:hypothetical protein